MVKNGWICRNDWISFFCFIFILRSNEMILIHQSDWNDNEMNIKQNDELVWISESISNRKECMISINLSFDLIVYSTLVHSSLNSNKCEDGKGENENNNQTQISYLFEGSYKYVWSHNSFQFDLFVNEYK